MTLGTSVSRPGQSTPGANSGRGTQLLFGLPLWTIWAIAGTLDSLPGYLSQSSVEDRDPPV